MIVTTTPSVEGRKIAEYRGIVTGEAIIIGAWAFESKMQDARDTALGKLEQRAASMGANAVLGVALDYETTEESLMVSASGTAVVLA